MSYVVFWLEGDRPLFSRFTDLHLTDALALAHRLRGTPAVSHVTLSSENPNQVGSQGVSSVENGLLPDGTPYDWKKRRL